MYELAIFVTGRVHLLPGGLYTTDLPGLSLPLVGTLHWSPPGPVFHDLCARLHGLHGFKTRRNFDGGEFYSLCHSLVLTSLFGQSQSMRCKSPQSGEYCNLRNQFPRIWRYAPCPEHQRCMIALPALLQAFSPHKTRSFSIIWSILLIEIARHHSANPARHNRRRDPQPAHQQRRWNWSSDGRLGTKEHIIHRIFLLFIFLFMILCGSPWDAVPAEENCFALFWGGTSKATAHSKALSTMYTSLWRPN